MSASEKMPPSGAKSETSPRRERTPSISGLLALNQLNSVVAACNTNPCPTPRHSCSVDDRFDALTEAISTINLNLLALHQKVDHILLKGGSTPPPEPEIREGEGIKKPTEEDFETIKLISNGAYGAVYLVRHKETRVRFALKKINKHTLVLRNQVEQAFSERDIMTFADNPFVVSMFCSFETKKHLCLVMEYVEGGDCATLLKQMGPLPVEMARFYFAETVMAVEYLHNCGIVHRDLKPDNLLITAFGHIKLTDFGLSKVGLINMATNLYEGFSDKASTVAIGEAKNSDAKLFNDNQVVGTAEYIAPEVILRQGYGKPVDWWSCGIILYQFLIGCVPFFGDTPEELFGHVVNDAIEWPPDDDWPVVEEAKQIIEALLHRNPLDRLGTRGAAEVKNHAFFEDIDWESLLRMKAEFVPQLEGDEDTSYFDTRSDHYNHELDSEGDFDDSDDSSSLFSSFSSCSPRYQKVCSRLEKSLVDQENLLRQSSSTSSLARGEESPSNININMRQVRSGSLYSEMSPVGSKISRTQSVTEDGRVSPSIRRQPNLSVVVTENTPPSSRLEKGHSQEGQTSPVPPHLHHHHHHHRKQYGIHKMKDSLPKLAFSFDSADSHDSIDIKSPREETISEEGISESSTKTTLQPAQNARVNLPSVDQSGNPSRTPVTKSASASGLSLMVTEAEGGNIIGKSGHKDGSALPAAVSINRSSPIGSNTSSRDPSPNRDINSLANQLKPPIILVKGPRGFGFGFRAIRVYYGDTDVYTVHHLVSFVQHNSPAFDAGLRVGDLITHINDEAVQGLLHHQVLKLMLSGGERVNIRTTPLENTTIKSGGRKRNPGQSRMARRPAATVRTHKHHKHGTAHVATGGVSIRRTDSMDKKHRPTPLLRRLSSKKAVEHQQKLCHSPPLLTPPSTGHVAHRRLSAETSPLVVVSSPLRSGSGSGGSCSIVSVSGGAKQKTTAATRISMSDSSRANSSQSSSPASSTPNSPAERGASSTSPNLNRPSSLYGLKNRIVQSVKQSRRKSVGSIPLSPLARGTGTGSGSSPQVIVHPTSPTRSLSSLAVTAGQKAIPNTGGAVPPPPGERPKSTEPDEQQQTNPPLLKSSSIGHNIVPKNVRNAKGCGGYVISPLVSSDMSRARSDSDASEHQPVHPLAQSNTQPGVQISSHTAEPINKPNIPRLKTTSVSEEDVDESSSSASESSIREAKHLPNIDK